MTEESGSDQPQQGPAVDWNDPNIPAGNSPPLAGWPMWLSAVMWGGFAAFLITLAVSG